MKQNNARSFMRETLLSGYRHHPYSLEQELSDFFLKGEGDSAVADALSLETYADILAPERLRAMKNALICFVAVISRSVISRGVDSEKSFSVSDYYINCIEQHNSISELQALLNQITEEYRTLVEEAESKICSLPIQRAMEYVKSHIYGPCNVSDMAKAVGYNPQYLATIFKAETGQTPTEYIRMQKMSEAKELLLHEQCSIAEVSQSLGYCNASYFIQDFKRFYGQTPKQFQKTGGLSAQ